MEGLNFVSWVARAVLPRFGIGLVERIATRFFLKKKSKQNTRGTTGMWKKGSDRRMQYQSGGI
jgi:hypothetical protein